MTGKPAPQADAKAQKSAPPKPSQAPKGAKGAKSAALPDAALLDDEPGDASVDTAASTRTGLRAWMPASTRGWVMFGSGAAGAVVIAIGAVVGLSAMSAPAVPAITALSGAASAVDGASIIVGGRTVRLEGIEAPPSSLVCRDGPWKYRCGEDARRGLEKAIGGQHVECALRRTDEAVCRNEMGFDIAAVQVESGWAVIDVRHSSRYFAEQARAQQDARGLWRNDFARPETWRLAERGDKAELAGISAAIKR
jgi:endonuclease YncB( thermonuclease family)